MIHCVRGWGPPVKFAPLVFFEEFNRASITGSTFYSDKQGSGFTRYLGSGSKVRDSGVMVSAL